MKRAVLIVNLGSPDSFEVPDVKRYLGEFLMDERVIDLPRPLRWLLIKGIILNTRPKKSAAAYKSIWWPEGSPLIVISNRFFDALKTQLPIPSVLGMRYGNPSIKSALQKLKTEHPEIEELLLVPLYPHYAMSSYETVVEKVKDDMKMVCPEVSLSVLPPFYDNDAYIELLAESIKPHLNKPFDKLLFSFHGIPERHVKKSDPTGAHCLKVEDCCKKSSPAHDYCYRHQVFTTAWMVVEKLGLTKDQYDISFQSRLGTDPWLRPFTDKKLEEYPKQGVKKLIIVCPAFVSDCLETLEEIAMEGKHSYLESGGEEFTMVPCLNDDPEWVKVMSGWIQAEITSKQIHA